MRRLLVGFFAAIGVLAVLFVHRRRGGGHPPAARQAVASRQHHPVGGFEPRARRRARRGRLAAAGPRWQAEPARLSRRAARPPEPIRGSRAFSPASAMTKPASPRRSRCATRSPPSAPRASSRSPSPTVSANSGSGTRPYYLATAFDQIWLQPMGSLGLTGLYAESTFFKGTLDLVGIAPEFDHRGQFKTAANVLTETRMTPPAREEVEDLLDFDLGAGRRRHRAGPQTVAGRGPRRDRPCAAAPQRGVAGQARRPARLSRRRDRRGPQAGRLGRRDRRPSDLSRRRRSAEPQGRADRADLRFGADRPRRRRRQPAGRLRSKWRRTT